MKPASRRGDLERLLRDAPAPAPPADLAARIKSEVPAALSELLGQRPARRFPAGFGWSFSRLSLAGSLAAHAAVLIVAVAIGWWLRAAWVPAPPASLGSPEGSEQTAAPRPAGPLPADAEGFLSTSASPVSRVALTAEAGSLDAVRRYLDAGFLPPPAAVRPAEIISAVDYGDPAPREGVALAAEGGPSPFSADGRRRLLRFNVRTRVVDPLDRPPASIAFLVDVSGAMKDDHRLDVVKGALSDLFRALRPQDRVALIAFSDQARVVRGATSDARALAGALDELTAEDSSSTADAVEQAFALAQRSFTGRPCTKIVVCSGGFSGRDLSWASGALSRIGAQARGGTQVAAIGLGLDAVGDEFLARLAGVAHGTYSYADDRAAARGAFLEQLTGAPQTIAADAEARVDFNPHVVNRYRLVGYEPAAATAPFSGGARGLPVDIDAGQTLTSLYEVELQSGVPDENVATFSLRYRPAGRLAFVNETHELRAADLAGTWETAAPTLRLAASAAELANGLCAAPERRDFELEAAFRRASAAARSFPGRADAAGLAALVGAARRARPYSDEAAAFAGAAPPFSIVVGEASEPVVVQRFEPQYPDEARRRRIEGVVLLRVHVDVSGAVERVDVLNTIPLLDPAALAAVRRWKYRPSLLAGQPVPGDVTVGVKFQLAP